MFEPVNKIIKTNPPAKSKIMQSAQICYFAENIIKDLVPEAVDKIKIISFANNILKIASSDSIILHEIKMNEEGITKKIQQKINIPRFRIIYLPKENS